VQSAGILRVQTTCPSCQGAGAVITDPCEACRGRGYVQERAKLDVTIPAGIDDGMRVRLAGLGEPSPDGGPPGDAYCFVTVRKHRLFQREGTHLILQMPITFSQAALGATIEVPTLDGPSEIKVPPGTQSGEVFRLRGRGVADPRGGSPGDLHVQTHIEVPKKLTPRQQELLREMAELEHSNVSPQRKSFLERIRQYFAPVEQERSEGPEKE
jgi:molecular chaperone DnaJ